MCELCGDIPLIMMNDKCFTHHKMPIYTIKNLRNSLLVLALTVMYLLSSLFLSLFNEKKSSEFCGECFGKLCVFRV